MPVSERERAYMERIGRWKADSHAEAMAEQQARPIAERLRHSWALFEAYRDRTNVSPVEDRAPSLYARARTLNLYRP